MMYNYGMRISRYNYLGLGICRNYSRLVWPVTNNEEDTMLSMPLQNNIFKSKIFNISAICYSDSYMIEKIIPTLSEKFQSTPWISPNKDMIHIPIGMEQVHTEDSFPPSELVVFRHGVVIGWNMTEATLQDNVMGWLKPFEILHKGVVEPIHETESMIGQVIIRSQKESTTEESSTFSYVRHDKIVLGLKCNNGISQSQAIQMYHSSKDLFMERIAFSHGLARSVKLSFLEQLLEKFLEKLRDVPYNLAIGGKIPYDRPTVMKHLGHLLHVRSQLNLHSELVESLPDLYWDEDSKLESIYYHMSRYLAVPKRIDTLNAKLDYANELTSLLRLTLTEEHGHNLERMIIVLIMIEIGFEIVHVLF